MLKKVVFSILGLALFVGCQDNRPSGPEVEDFLTLVNKVSKRLPKGDHNEYYRLLSKDFIDRFDAEIEKAKTMDSLSVRQLPPMEMLRILSLKNAMSQVLKSGDNKMIMMNWLEAAGKGFPLQNADRFYYATKTAIERKMLKDGGTFPQVLIIEEGGSLRVDPFNTEAYQQRRLDNILKKTNLDQLIKESAWMHFQIDRTINWVVID